MNKTIKLLFLLIIVLLFIFAFLPPFERDELVYQLAISKIWNEKGFIEIGFSHYSYYPWLPFIFNVFFLSTGFVSLSHIFHLFLGVLTAYLIYSQIEDKRVGWLTVLLFITLQPFLRFGYAAYSDFYLLFFSTASFVFIKKWNESGRKDFLYLSAVLCGFALNCKYNMLVMALLLYVIVLWLSYNKNRRFIGSLKTTLAYCLVSLFMFAPFLIKNHILTGNPFYPFFTGIIPTDNPYQFENVSHFLFRKYFYNENIFQILSTPFKAFLYGKENEMRFFDGVLNPFFLIIPVVPLFINKKKEQALFFSLAWCYNAFVLFLEPVSARFLLPSLPILAIVAGRWLSSLRLKPAGLYLIFIPCIMFNLYFAGKHLIDKDKYLYLFGQISKSDFLKAKSPDYNTVLYINSSLPDNARVMMLFTGHRTYYLDREFIYDSFNDGRLWDGFFKNSGRPEDIAKRLKNEGITHIFLRRDLFGRFLEDNYDTERISLCELFFSKNTKTLFVDKEFMLFEVL